MVKRILLILLALGAFVVSAHASLIIDSYKFETTQAEESEFNPSSDVTGCLVWLDVLDTGTITQSTSPNVSQWDDKSGNGNDFAQTTGSSQPTWNSVLENIGFDGSNDLMDCGSALLSADSDYTVFLVVNSDSWNQGGNGKLLFASGDMSIRSFSAGKIVVYHATNQAQFTGTTALSNDTWYVVCVSYDSSENDTFLYVSNIQDASQLGSDNHSGTGENTSIGGLVSANAYGDVFFRSTIFYNTFLSSEDRASVYEFLKAEYDTQ